MGSVGETTSFGHAMRSHFLFDAKWTNVNHGSFGTYPAPVRNALRGYQKLTEAAPDKFMKYQYVELLDNARERVASLLNAPMDECVFVLNASTGTNTVLRNLTYKSKDAIIYFDVTYSAAIKSLIALVETNPEIHIRRVGEGQDGWVSPTSHAAILNAFSQTVSRLLYEGYTPKVAIFDTIASLPGIRFPFERLVKICKEYGILSLIDGAHGVGHIPLDLTSIDADFFTSNCHKWLYTPRGCAVLHVPKRNQHLIRTTYPTSHGYIPPPGFRVRTVLPPSTKSDFINLFQFTGTADNNPFYCVPAALNFRANICGGEAAIYEYIRDVAQRGADRLAEILGTRVMDGIDPDSDEETPDDHTEHEDRSGPSAWVGGIRDCAMANVLLPIVIEGSGYESAEFSNPVIIQREDVMQHINWIYDRMTFDLHTHVLIFEYNNRMWTRISGQIYLEISDFEWLGRILKELLERVRNGESSTPPKASSMSNGNSIDLEAIGRRGDS